MNKGKAFRPKTYQTLSKIFRENTVDNFLDNATKLPHTFRQAVPDVLSKIFLFYSSNIFFISQ